MNCITAKEHLSAWIDGELAQDLASNIEHHLADCESCATVANELRVLNGELADLFAESRNRSQALATKALEQRAVEDESPKRHKAANRFPSMAIWLVSLAVATAAGFLGAMLVFRPSTQQRDDIRPNLVQIEPEQQLPLPATTRDDSHFATVNLATGPVEVTSIDLPTMTCPTYPAVPVGMQMQTGTRKCELTTPAGSTIRLDCETSVSVSKKHEIVLQKGRLWCSQRGDAPMVIKTNGAEVTIENAVCAFECGEGDTELATLEGEVRVEGGAWSSTVKAGKRMRYDQGRVLNESGLENPVMATRWVHDLLRKKSSDDAELATRIEKLWAALGYSKMQNLYEYELRCMGPSCVTPLSSYLKSNAKTHQDPARRTQAAKIVADVADFQAAPLFIDLLTDQQPEVRFHAARGLQRLTGRSQAATPEQWRSADSEQRNVWLSAWRDWLENEAERFPPIEVPEQSDGILPSKA